jgi:cyclase
MNRIRIIALLGLLGLLGLAAVACQKASQTSEPPPSRPIGATEPEAVPIVTVPVAGAVSMLEGAGGNVGVSAGPDGVLLIDAQFIQQVPGILEAVRALGKGEPELVINTHWHGDHTGGNPALGASAHIIAHQNVRRRLSTRQEVRGRVVEPLPHRGLPVVTFAESVTIHFNGEEIRVVHLPTGHTDGDSVVFFTGSNVVHMGDHFFAGRFPYVDVGSGGDPLQYTRNVASVLEQIDEGTRVIPGHGKLTDRAGLEEFHRMLVDTTEVVRAAKQAGRSLPQAQKAGLPAAYRGWGGGFITAEVWIETLYRSL